MGRSVLREPREADDAKRIREALDQFEDAWRADGSVDLGRFLPPPGDPLRPALLLELIRADLALRWNHGPHLEIEAYQKSYPELGQTAAELPVEYIYEEYRARWLYGDQPSLGIYHQRFPRQFEALEQLIRARPISAIAPPSQLTVGPTVFTPPPPVPTPPPPAQALEQLLRDNPAAVHAPSDTPTLTPAGLPTMKSPPPSPARTLSGGGGYRLIERLGQGAFGEVWKAERPQGVPVAVKRVLAPVDHSKARQELKALEQIKRLQHPFLVQTQDYFVEDNELYIVMDLAEGTLRSRLAEHQKAGRTGFPAEELLRHFQEAAEALDFLHSQNVQHRDVKPDNILLLQGHAKVADFGLARFLEEQQGSVQATAGIGTPAYMAPEVWRGKVSVKSDQYSLAAAFVELHLGRPLFAFRNPFEMMEAHVRTTPDLAPAPPEVQQVLLRALAKESADRFPTCVEFVDALKQAVLPPPPMPTTEDRAEGERGPVRRRRRWPEAVILLVAAAVAGWLLADRWLHPPTSAGFTLSEPQPVFVRAGTLRTMGVAVNRDRFTEPVELSCEDVPAGIKITPATIPANAAGAELGLRVPPDTPEGDYQIRLTAAANGQRQETVFELKVQPRAYYLPAGWKRADDAREQVIGERVYYDKIDVGKGKEPARFLFIGGGEPAKLEPFYIMENKVWIGLYAAFADDPANAGLLKYPGSKWKDKGLNQGSARLPVMGIVARDAHAFAQWLGGPKGFLPSAEQWDKAAGRYENTGRDGPFEGKWDPTSRDQIAVNRAKEGPMEVGTAPQDSSPFLVRDLSGNGNEWTRTPSNLRDVQPVDISKPPQRPTGEPEEVMLCLRGHRYDRKTPLYFKDLNGGDEHPGDELLDGKPMNYIGFRVVIEP